MNNRSDVPMFCPICEFAMNSSSDVDSFEEFQCCFECEMKWAQSRKIKWKKGWRPHQDEVDQEKEKKSKIPPSFNL